MDERVYAPIQGAIFEAAISCNQRQYPAEPLWFALMCREIYGTNAPKELRFQLDRSERTCRAWSSGDSDPPATILAALQRGEDGWQALEFLMRDSEAKWWRQLIEDRRQAAIFRSAVREASK